MKKLILPIACLALALAACGEKPAPAGSTPAETPKTDAAATAAAKPAPAQTGKSLAGPLPQGVTLGFPVHVRYDRIEAKKGRNQRLILVETLEEGSGKALRASMKAAGFRLSTPVAEIKPEEDGSRRLLFVKKGWKGNVTAIITPKGDRKLQNKNATGTIYFIWNDPALADAPATAAPAEAAAATPATDAPATPAAAGAADADAPAADATAATPAGQ